MRIRPHRGSRQGALGLGIRPGHQFRYGEPAKGDRAYRGTEDNEIISGSAGW